MESGAAKEIEEVLRSLILPVEERKVAVRRKPCVANPLGFRRLGVTACGAAWRGDHLVVQFALLRRSVNDARAKDSGRGAWTSYAIPTAPHTVTAEVSILPTDDATAAPLLFCDEDSQQALSDAVDAATERMEKLGASTLVAAIAFLEEELAQKSPTAFRHEPFTFSLKTQQEDSVDECNDSVMFDKEYNRVMVLRSVHCRRRVPKLFEAAAAVLLVGRGGARAIRLALCRAPGGYGMRAIR